MNYLAPIETKPGALDQAAALQCWALPPAFQHLRHLLEARVRNPGKGVHPVAALVEVAAKEVVAAAVADARLTIIDELAVVDVSVAAAAHCGAG
ncbi:hypothetical protein ACLF3G_23625 [Falsiroseomonas sp. HC035]|uniref:hypothetical protein n=1 Tax=Falsiroseomonas sp. HC035 TaxID=3390999 RepID=UPI003D323DF8